MRRIDAIERYYPLWIVVLVAGFLLVLRYDSGTELSISSPFMYTLWGVLVWMYTPRVHSFWSFIIVACALRFGCVGAGFVWSDDAYRYLWEGKVVLNGFNPYTSPPASFGVQDGVREYVNHPTIPTVYPPLAQLWFALQTYIWYNPVILQVTSALVDVGTATAIWTLVTRQNLSVRSAWIYALHPLPIIECVWSAHIESLAVFCLAWGLVLYERWGRWVWFVGGWVKLLPFAFLPFTRGWGIRTIVLMVTLSILLLLPFWDSMSLRGLQTYIVHWSYNASIFSLVSLWKPAIARPVCLVMGMLAGAYVWWSWYQLHLSIYRAILWLSIIVVLCSPTVHPWYALWVMVPSLMVNEKVSRTVCILWCSLIPLTYISIFTLNPLTGEWSPPLWPTLVSYLVPLALWLRVQFKRV